MKTEEDEAFEDIERRQGGFHAKRQAAMDKINAEFDEEYIKYREAFPKGYTAPQPAQEPKFWEMPDGKIVNKWRLQFYNGVVGAALYTTPPKRPWVGLTDEDIKEIHNLSFGKDIGIATGLTEAKLKEKNG